jgi:RNA polymerase sigma-70 factor (ECF subfamily)
MREIDQIDERERLELSRQGDEDAFAYLVEQYQTPVFNLCFRMLGDRQEAEDAAQEVFLKAFKNIRKYDPDRVFINWILTIASNHCIDRIRKRRFHFISLEDWEQGQREKGIGVGVESTIILQEGKEEIQAYIDHLGTQDRAAVILRYWYDLTYEEIASSLSLSVGAVKSRLHRARRALAEMWQDQHGKLVTGKRTQDEPSTV